MERRAQLKRYIAESRINQRRFNRLLLGLVAIAIGALLWSTGLGVVALLMTGIVGVAGHWVIYAHIASHETELETLERRALAPAEPQSGGHRRWQHAAG